jgi:hypothetical protein
VGTSPYHCWLTAFGADAVGVGEPDAWCEDLAGLHATAALTNLWLSVRDYGEEVGLCLVSWRRLHSGCPYRDPRTGTPRELPVEAELVVAFATTSNSHATILVVARIERGPAARLTMILARFASFLAACSEANVPMLGVLARTPRVADGVLTAVESLGEAPAGRRLGPSALAAARHRMIVGMAEPHPLGVATEAVWRTPGEPRSRRLVDVLAERGSGK